MEIVGVVEGPSHQWLHQRGHRGRRRPTLAEEAVGARRGRQMVAGTFQEYAEQLRIT